MKSECTTSHAGMPHTAAAAKQRVRHVLAEAALREPGFAYSVTHVATGRHLERVIVLLPFKHFDETEAWFDKLLELLPWACRVTMIPEVGRIEIEPRTR